MRVANRLSYISANTFGAFSSITTRGLLYIQYRGFITILVSILVSATTCKFRSMSEMNFYNVDYYQKKL